MVLPSPTLPRGLVWVLFVCFTVELLATCTKRTHNDRFVWDFYRTDRGLFARRHARVGYDQRKRFTSLDDLWSCVSVFQRNGFHVRRFVSPR